MRKHYWACIPGSSGPPAWTLDNCRIEWANTAAEATQKAFGRSYADDSKLAEHDIGIWLAKDLGSRVSIVQSDSKRRALFMQRTGWIDPFSYRVKFPEEIKSEHGHHLATVEIAAADQFIVKRISTKGEAVTLPGTFSSANVDMIRMIVKRTATHQWNWREWDLILKGLGLAI